ncbi:MAG: glycosyltransferase [Alphaproteobacteria bacterium]
MSSEALGPNLLVAGALILICAFLPGRSNRARAAFSAVAVVATLRYLWWRWTDTIAPLEGSSAETLWMIGCFVVEAVVMLESIIGMVVLARTIDRTKEADGHEAWLRALPLDEVPTIDVFIPTYNEGRDVLERSIVGALALDYPKFAVHVLDDGRRPWLEALCKEKGARYLTRGDNKHAKSGNINAAIPRTSGDLIAVLDADFVPHRNFLWRTAGFFRDPVTACVQTPQYFFNKDPVQTNLGMSNAWGDDQRLFFDVILPSRDAWGAAFCCGTGFLMRRTAIEAIGGIPTGSICEDMLTSMEWKRRGLETVYLNEELCIGLAPESINAYFVQRQRWARGQMQILFLKNGVFSRGLPFFYRLIFLPTYWFIQLPSRIVYILLPIIYLLTGLPPVLLPSQEALVGYLGPAMIGGVGLIWWAGRGAFLPILTDASNLFIAIRVAPTALASLIKPFGVPFRVTPKGREAKASRHDGTVFWFSIILLALSIGGLAWNALDDWRPIANELSLALTTLWILINSAILGLTALIACEGPRFRAEERFALDMPARATADASTAPCIVGNLSPSGAFVRFGNYPTPETGETIALSIASIGLVEGLVVRRARDGVGVRFTGVPDATREAITRLARTESKRENARRRQAIRLKLDRPARSAANGRWTTCLVADASLTGALVDFDEPPAVATGDLLTLEIPEIGIVSARVKRLAGLSAGLEFEDLSDHAKDALIRALYTIPRASVVPATQSTPTLFLLMLKRAFGPGLIRPAPTKPADSPR